MRADRQVGAWFDRKRERNEMNETRWSRRAALGLAVGSAAAVLGRGAVAAPITQRKDDPDSPTRGLRPGPFGLGPSPVVRPVGVQPVALQIERAGVDAPIEYLQIVDGVMQNPTGPWVVGWYVPTARPGEPGNVVMSGHVDYYTVGPAVFWSIRDLVEGDEMMVIGEDGSSFLYSVTWTNNYPVATITPEAIAEIVNPTKRESLTLITCTGTFDQGSAEYSDRYVVRGERFA
jgi:hypothetical protein